MKPAISPLKHPLDRERNAVPDWMSSHERIPSPLACGKVKASRPGAECRASALQMPSLALSGAPCDDHTVVLVDHPAGDRRFLGHKQI